MMRVKFIIFILFITAFSPINLIVQAQEELEPNVEILFPLPGEAAQGLLQISGTIIVQGFESYRLEFTFQTSSDSSWFEITRSDSAITEGVIGEWDTSSIPDGNYNLKLTVNLSSGESITRIVEGVRVRNYSPIETNTPTPTSISPTMTLPPMEMTTPTPTPEIRKSPTPLDPNPASLEENDIQKAVLQGAFVGVLIFIVFLIYRAARFRK